MIITDILKLAMFFRNGVTDTLLSWVTSNLGSSSGVVDPGIGKDIRIRIYSRCNEYEFREFPVDEALGVFNSQFFDFDLQTVIFALPYLTDIEDEDNKEVIKAMCNRCNFNIIVLDNSCNINTKDIVSYPVTMVQVYTDAQRYSNVINRAMAAGLVRGESITALGYSLGAQMIGHVCRLMQPRCGALYAFDPAGPFYLPPSSGVSSSIPHLRLVAKGDADLVVVVGCNEGVIGTPFRSGDINVHVNGGTVQPGCPALSMTCNHRFCRKVMLESIRSPGSCQTRFCSSKKWFDKGFCNFKEIFALTVPSEIHYNIETHESIDSYMNTMRYEYCQGWSGSVGVE